MRFKALALTGKWRRQRFAAGEQQLRVTLGVQPRAHLQNLFQFLAQIFVQLAINPAW
jgi:hypothetical protein